MSSIPAYANRLLALADEAVLARLRPHLVRIELKRRDVMAEAGAPVRWIYFIEDGIGSIVGQIDEREVEIGLFGRDGMSGCSILYGVDQPIHRTFMQVAGSAWRIEAETLTAILSSSENFRLLLVLYAYVLGLQIAETASANAVSSLDQRLARWLLMCDDRIDDGGIAITHEYMSVMLGARRPSVTLAIQTLEGAGMIRATRGRVEIRNRKTLLEVAGEIYGPAAAEQHRLLGPM